MSEIKALDNLRNWAKKYGPMGSHDPLMFADEIEREISERYMLLPVDADGVPIRVGDELFNKNKPTDAYKVTAIADNGYIRIYHDTAHIHSSQCRHVKPDTLKELLEEFTDALNSPAEDDGRDLCAEYAERIRELVGGDAS